MYKIPEDIKRYIDDTISHPVGLIGCRSLNPQISLDCCEYDLGILNRDLGHGRILKIANHNVKFINLQILPKLDRTLALKDMILLRDDNAFTLSSIINAIKPNIYRQILTASGKRAIINSIFHHEKISKTILSEPVLSSMWLKISAYDFLEGVLALSGSRPMPLHELSQIRALDIERQDIAEAVISALECIGIERASKSSISRCLEAIHELYRMRCGIELNCNKIMHLFEIGKISDCYYYIGRIGRKILLAKDDKFYLKYMKLICTSMDLSNDIQQIQKLHRYLLKGCKSLLKN